MALTKFHNNKQAQKLALMNSDHLKTLFTKQPWCQATLTCLIRNYQKKVAKHPNKVEKHKKLYKKQVKCVIRFLGHSESCTASTKKSNLQQWQLFRDLQGICWNDY